MVVKATGTGADSTIAGIGRLVADAQAKEAPIQRLADSVSGVFCYTVMAASAATFAFWTLAGKHLPSLHANHINKRFCHNCQLMNDIITT